VNRVRTKEGYQRVRDYLTNAINERAFEPGSRLPTERELAEQFGVSRAVTRRALGELESQGLIRRHVGRGTFVRSAAESNGEGKPNSISEGTISPVEYIESRLRFEPELAWMVASNATGADFERMEECLRRSENASTREEFELWDAAFHQAIAAATHNKLAIGVYEMIHAVRHEQAMWGTLKQRDEAHQQRPVYQREHREILDSLKKRDPERARDIMTQHVRATRRRLFDY
jgi:DNA-binding FadR family transcriptional regulator